MAKLNKTYRGISKPTNVLAFPMQEGEFSDITPGLLGDVVISMETAEREAITAEISLEERTSQLLIHGILHLLGFDHERGDAEARTLWQHFKDVSWAEFQSAYDMLGIAFEEVKGESEYVQDRRSVIVRYICVEYA